MGDTEINEWKRTRCKCVIQSHGIRSSEGEKKIVGFPHVLKCGVLSPPYTVPFYVCTTRGSVVRTALTVNSLSHVATIFYYQRTLEEIEGMVEGAKFIRAMYIPVNSTQIQCFYKRSGST